MLRVFKLKENDPLLWTQKLKNFEVQIKGYNLAFQAIVVQTVATVSFFTQGKSRLKLEIFSYKRLILWEK